MGIQYSTISVIPMDIQYSTIGIAPVNIQYSTISAVPVDIQYSTISAALAGIQYPYACAFRSIVMPIGKILLWCFFQKHYYADRQGLALMFW
jgi:hypothetical protein